MTSGKTCALPSSSALATTLLTSSARRPDIPLLGGDADMGQMPRGVKRSADWPADDPHCPPGAERDVAEIVHAPAGSGPPSDFASAREDTSTITMDSDEQYEGSCRTALKMICWLIYMQHSTDHNHHVLWNRRML